MYIIKGIIIIFIMAVSCYMTGNLWMTRDAFVEKILLGFATQLAVFNILCIPKTQIMITSDEYLVLVRQFYKPVQEVKNLFLCALFCEVATMDDNISFWKIGQFIMSVVGI